MFTWQNYHFNANVSLFLCYIDKIYAVLAVFC